MGIEKPKLPEFPLPSPPKISDLPPTLREKVEPGIKEILGEKGIGKIVGDVVGGIFGIGDSVVKGVTKTADSVVEGIDKSLREIGRK